MRLMFLGRATSVAALLALTAFVGCDSGVKTVPVEGTVTLGTEPLKEGSIAFHPDSAKGNGFGSPVSGTVENGKYKLAIDGKDGAPLGAYKVTVTATVKVDPKDEYSITKSIIAEKFTVPANTPLTAEVKSGGGPYDFKVSK